MTKPHFEQLPALLVGMHDDPLKLEIMEFNASDLEHFWPLSKEIANTLPHTDFQDPLTESEIVVPGTYSSPQTLIDTLDAAGFKQGGLFATRDRQTFLAGHVALRPSFEATELKVHLLDPRARLATEVALSATVRLAAHAQEDLYSQAVQLDVLESDQLVTAACVSAGFTHIPKQTDYDTIALGAAGEEFSHFQTWELRDPDTITDDVPDALRQKYISGWQNYMDVRKFVRW